MMKRIYILFLAASCILSSCNMLSKNMAEKEKAQINAAKIDALNEIKNASTKAISTAENEISSATKESIASASEDLNSAIKEAEKSIASSVATEINKTVAEDKQKTDQRIREMAKLQFAVLILSLLALGASIASIVMLRRRTSRDTIIEEVLHSKRVKVFIEEISEGINSNRLKEIKTQVQSSTRSINVDSEIRKALESPYWKNYFSGLLKLRESPSGYKDNTISSIQQNPDKTGNQAEQKSVERPSTATNVPKVELFARDTTSLELTGVSPSYQPGKSIFRLVLNSNEASTANIEICSDKQVLQRIIQSDQELIEPVCKIVSKVNKPSDIKWTAGRAEKVDADTWKVCEQVIVELV